jgi:excisionase family DNA binding protein
MLDMSLCNAKDSRMAETPPTLLSTVQACERIRIDRSTLSRWIKDGTAQPAMRLPGKTGAYLFTEAEVERLAEQYRGTPSAEAS